MALIHCPECDQQISNQALSCPGCAHPLAPPPPNSPIFGSAGPAVTVRPDFWHDPNVGAVGALVAFVVILALGALFVGISH